jgi:hypothetical protein
VWRDVVRARQQPDGAPMAAINTRCLDGVDVQALAVKHFDGASMH